MIWLRILEDLQLHISIVVTCLFQCDAKYFLWFLFYQKIKGVPHKTLDAVDDFHGHFRTQRGRLPQETLEIDFRGRLGKNEKIRMFAC